MSMFSGLRSRPGDQLGVEAQLPEFDGAIAWLNSLPLTPAELRGKVVLVQFWTFTCINWLRTLPYVRAWAEKYGDDLVTIGVHTPEFRFEHDVESVRRASEGRQISYPVAIDSDYRVWSAFANRYWPALFFADSQGAIRHHHFGEGEYDRSERVLQALLAEAGAADVDRGLTSVEGHGDEAAADWDHLESPETYVGYERSESFASPGGAVPDERHPYTAPARLGLNQWALSGDWTVGREGAELDGEGGLAFRFSARDLHLVMGPISAQASVAFRVTLDGRAPGPSHGTDVDEDGNGVASGRRLYQLVRQSEGVGEHTCEVTFGESAGPVGAYVFTFG